MTSHSLLMCMSETQRHIQSLPSQMALASIKQYVLFWKTVAEMSFFSSLLIWVACMLETDFKHMPLTLITESEWTHSEIMWSVIYGGRCPRPKVRWEHVIDLRSSYFHYGVSIFTLSDEAVDTDKGQDWNNHSIYSSVQEKETVREKGSF